MLETRTRNNRIFEALYQQAILLTVLVAGASTSVAQQTPQDAFSGPTESVVACSKLK